jgi:acyl-coenzyme A thioesterase PaaI-like protein
MSQDHVPTGASAELQAAAEVTANQCFGCSKENPQGLHLVFTFDTSDALQPRVSAPVHLTRLHEGPPGYIHGGIIATLLDEAMGKLNVPLGLIAMTRNMEVDYLRPSPLFTPLTLVGTHLRREGTRKLFHQAELIGPDGIVLARAKGFFLAIDPAMLGPGAGRMQQ